MLPEYASGQGSPGHHSQLLSLGQGRGYRWGMKNAYQPVTSVELKTITGPRPGVRAVLDTILWFRSAPTKEGFGGVTSGGIYNRRPVRGKTVLNPGSASLHSAGRALDIVVPSKKAGDELCLRLIAAADAIGICEIIWWEKRFTSKGEKAYKGASPHKDHIHVGFTADWGARANTPDLRKWVSHFVFGA